MQSANDSKPPFERTVCGCQTCIQCCKDQPGPLIPGDFERIAEFLGESAEEAKLHFWASPGAQVLDKKSGEIFGIGSITPIRANGRCVFLDENDRCKIHPVAPAGCAYFDTHMDTKTARPRSAWMLMQMMGSEAYRQLRSKLRIATSYKPKTYKCEL